MTNPADILEKALREVKSDPQKTFIHDDDLRSRIEFICQGLANKAPIRFLMACLLGKLTDPKVDIRKPYTEIGGKGAYSGRAYDKNLSSLL